MPELANPVTKTRVQIDLANREVERMNWIMAVCEMESRKDLFNNSITLLEWAVNEIREGRKIGSFDDDKQERYTLSMPILSNAARSADKLGARSNPEAA